MQAYIPIQFLLKFAAPLLRTATWNKLPVLKSARVQQGEGGITLTTTDLDRWVSVTLGEPSAITFDEAFDLGELVAAAKAAKGDFLELRKEGDDWFACSDSENLSVRHPVNWFPSSEFPEFPEFCLFEGETRRAGDLLDCLVETQPATSDDQTRYVLNGWCVELDGTVVATDGRMLNTVRSTMKPPSKADIKRMQKNGRSGNFIIPTSKFFAAVKRLNPRAATYELVFPPPEGKKKVSTEPANAIALEFFIGPVSVKFTSKLIEGNYPNWRQVIPTLGGTGTTVLLPDKGLASKIAALPVKEKRGSIVVTIDRNAMEMKLSSQGSTVRSTVLPTDGTRPKNLTSSVAKEFLLYAVERGYLRMSYDTGENPLLFHRGDAELIVAMPMRVQGEVPKAKAEVEPELEEALA